MTGWAILFSALAMTAIVGVRYLITSGAFAFATRLKHPGLYRGLEPQMKREVGWSLASAAIYGIPAGHEFASVIEAICLVSSGKTKTLPDKVREEIEKIDSPLEIKVFVTTTCPYCAGAVITAHEMAFVNPHITGKMIESMEFPEWAGKHNVYTVPKIIINDKVEFEGAVPVKEYAKKVIEAHHAGEKKLIVLP